MSSLPIRAPALAALSTVVATLCASPARANPRPLPFTYIYETLAEGEAELEQYADLTPVRVYPAGETVPAWYGATQFQTEFEYGLTDRLELGLYFTFVPTNPSFSSFPKLPEGNGIKQRLRYRFGNPGSLPVDIALYGEVVENEREIELEGKLILQRRVGPVRLAANAWVERELYYSREHEWVVNPTIGAVLELSPSVQPGLEYWARAEFSGKSGPRDFDEGPNHYAGPTLLLQLGKIWWSSGLYLRWNDMHRTATVGDTFGNVWGRTILGVSL